MQFLSFFFFREYILVYLHLVFCYQTVGSLHYCLCRAVVLLEFEELRIGIYLTE